MKEPPQVHYNANRPSDYPTPGETDDEEYLKEVLHLADGQTEDSLDCALESEASASGVPTLHGNGKSWDSSLCEAIIASSSKHARYGSDGSRSSISSHLTSPRSSNDKTLDSSVDCFSVNRASVSFSEYDKFLSKSTHSAATTPHSPISSTPQSPRLSSERPSISGSSGSPSRKSVISFRHGLRNLSVRMGKARKPKDNECVSCHKDLKHTNTLRSLPCSHIYCNDCLHDLAQQAILAESRMPPKCCGIALPTHLLKSILSHHEQALFMKKFQEYSTPWEESVFCPSPSCGEFVPKPSKVDPRHPFQLTCAECGTGVCAVCKRIAHGNAVQCPLDYELESVRAGDGHSWRRCYNCQSLVKANPGCTSYITCRCKSKFCYTCGAVWDAVDGCPNNCHSNEKKEPNQHEDNEAAKRTEESLQMLQFRDRRLEERDRFCLYRDEMQKRMWARHGQMKVDLLDRFAERESTMEVRHKSEISKQETRHLMKEAELLEEQAQYRRHVHTRIRHMENYCERLAHASGSESDMSSRSSLASDSRGFVTEKEREELRRQLHVRADIPRRQESEINVLRGKQEKQVEELEIKHETEVVKLSEDRQNELRKLQQTYAREEDEFNALFSQRRERLEHRWHLEAEVIRKKLETSAGLPFASLSDVEWPPSPERPSALSFELEKT